MMGRRSPTSLVGMEWRVRPCMSSYGGARRMAWRGWNLVLCAHRTLLSSTNSPELVGDRARPSNRPKRRISSLTTPAAADRENE